MREDTKETSLIEINEDSVFHKIKIFFKNLFNKKTITDNPRDITETNILDERENKKNNFIEDIKNIDNEETELLKLQKQYRAGEIQEKDLSEEQISSLCLLYDKQIANLKKSNEIRKQKILEYRRKLQTDS